MDSAIYKKTGLQYYAWQIWMLGTFEEKNLHKKGLWLCPQEEIENIDEIKEEIYVTPVIEHERKNILVPSFFRLYPKYSDKVRLVKESEEHKKAKTVVCVVLTEKFNFQLEYDREIYLVKNLPIDYKKIQDNIKKREVTKHNILTNEKKRADVLIPFIFNSYWGNGLVIEIRISEKDENIEEKESFWFQRGYSIIWMNESDFEIVDNRWGIKGNKLQVIPFSIGYNKILNEREKEMREYLHSMCELKDKAMSLFNVKQSELEDEYEKKQLQLTSDIISQRKACEELIADFRTLSVKTCRTCKHGSISRDNTGLIACWFGTTWGKGKSKGFSRYPNQHEPLDGCNNYENR